MQPLEREKPPGKRAGALGKRSRRGVMELIGSCRGADLPVRAPRAAMYHRVKVTCAPDRPRHNYLRYKTLETVPLAVLLNTLHA